MLEKLSPFLSANTMVAVEQQLGPNAQMSNIAHLCFGLLKSRVGAIDFVSSVSKFNIFVRLQWIEKSQIGRNKKNVRKKMATKIAKEIMQTTKCRDGIEEKFLSSKKKDDMGDALIYAATLADELEKITVIKNKNKRLLRVQI
jgi:hypothetical protein